MGNQPQAVDVEAILRAHPLEKGYVALSPVPEMEVVANDHGLGLHAADQQLGDEVLRRLLGPLPVEMDHQCVVHPCRSEQLELLVEVRQQAWRGLWTHDEIGRASCR